MVYALLMGGRKCEPGCTCKRHQMSDEKKAERAEKVKAGTARAKAEGKYSAMRQRIWDEMTPEKRAEWGRMQSEQKKKEWAQAKAEGRRRNRHYGTRKRTSKHELALVPYMAALGFIHDTGKRIGHRIPDFVKDDTHEIYEYFGTYWHDSMDDQKAKEFYALRGWTCHVLWESDLFDFLTKHQDLVTPEEHTAAWKAARINNGYKKPVSI